MTEPKVLAIILTYCAPTSLEECLASLAAQSRPADAVLVVDNTGPPLRAAAPAVPDGLSLRVLRTGENLGPAGGHARGLAWFRDGDWTHAWVMDDDCAPEPDTLAKLLARAQTMPDAHQVRPIRIDSHTRRVETPPAWCGVLISRAAVSTAGLPREDLFWWVEDTEYLKHRMRVRGVAIDRVDEAVVWHRQVRRTGYRPPWQYYYGMRNSTWYYLHVLRTPDSVRRWLRGLARMGARAAMTPPRRAHLAALAHGLADGLRGRLGRTVLPPPPTKIDT